MNFDELLVRAGEEVVQELLGSGTARLVRLVRGEEANLAALRKVLLTLRPPSTLLMEPASRALLLDALPPHEARRLATDLGVGSGEDPYVGLRGMSIAKNSRKESVLFSFFGVGRAFLEEAIVLPAVRQEMAGYPLFHHQRSAAREVLGQLDTEPRRVLLHMPTGAGKTRTAMNVIVSHLREHEPTLVVWLATTEELCEQAASEFSEAWHHLGDRELSIVRFWGDHEADLDQPKDGFIVAGLSKLYSSIRKRIAVATSLGMRTSLVVMDEAHQAVAETYSLLLDALVVMRPQNRLLGLTATPGRTWADIEEDRRLSEFFAKKKVTLSVEGYTNPVDYLVVDEFLARANFETLLHNPGMILSVTDLQWVQEKMELPPSVMKRLAEDEERNLAILLKAKQLVSKHSRVLLFATTVEHSELMASVLQACGIRSASITSKTPRALRTRLIDDFKEENNEPFILCNYGVLTTGFDAPRTSAAIIARPTMSLVLFSQMVGRAIRGRRAGGNREAQIVTVHDQGLPGFGSVAESFNNWEDVWS